MHTSYTHFPIAFGISSEKSYTSYTPHGVGEKGIERIAERGGPNLYYYIIMCIMCIVCISLYLSNDGYIGNLIHISYTPEK